MKILDIETIRRRAYVFGPSSAAAKALAEYERRVASDGPLCIMTNGAMLIVGPAPDTPDTLPF